MRVNTDSFIYFIFVFVLGMRCAFTLNNYGELQELYDEKDVYTNKWVIHVKQGAGIVNKIAKKHNFINHGVLGSLKEYYHLEHVSNARGCYTLLSNYSSVLWVQQQRVLKRAKRGYFSDPLFGKQWYIRNIGQTLPTCKEKLDLNVFPAWKSFNLSGAGVVVTVVDDGIEYTHPDLMKNYDPQASYDYNSNDNDPIPRYDRHDNNKHGTRCAGEVAAEGNNGVCGVGVAFNAKLGAIRMLDGKVTDAVEASSLSFARQHIDIYTSSWGPHDNGISLDGPGPLTQKALREGSKHGRNGLGSIFVWATGNGGHKYDYCSCDGYVNSPYTIAIGAVDGCGGKQWYTEECPGTLAVSYSSGICTTDLHRKCTTYFKGTSAAAPLAAGIFALVLEANPKVTWRDLQHLVVKTSRVVSPRDGSWRTNGAGHKVNPKFGFGVLDTGGLVKAATNKTWKTARQGRICETKKNLMNMAFKGRGRLETSLESDGCVNLISHRNCVTKLEHVQVVVTLEKYGYRGQLDITLTSPSGTKSPILRGRPRDNSYGGFRQWHFLTLFHWDENPTGKWQLTIVDHSKTGGKLNSWKLKLHGTCHIKANETGICNDLCKKGCPQIFADVCLGCSKYCDCTIGRCVSACDDRLLTDEQLRHCKLDANSFSHTHNTPMYLRYAIIPFVFFLMR